MRQGLRFLRRGKAALGGGPSGDGERADAMDDAGSRASTGHAEYDRFAPYFRAYSGRRDGYLSAVDAIVLRSIPSGARSMLDVGSGDGVRAARIARARGLTTLVLSDPSPAMLAACHRQGATAVWPLAAEELADTGARFDVITCLWNVLGHVPTPAKRVTALRRMRALLAPGGSIFLDVNNRYNARAYGWIPTLRRALFDRLRPSETNGDAVVIWPAGEEHIAARTHFFTPHELRALMRRADLRIERLHFVDYRTGGARRSALEGQLFCRLRAE
jgi:2-polyprenyl-3-methyl-5-hydroxy-6-metoxy-1,4-benzoquinol methylase